jgi:uncharacterized protein (DUF433 family)
MLHACLGLRHAKQIMPLHHAVNQHRNTWADLGGRSLPENRSPDRVDLYAFDFRQARFLGEAGRLAVEAATLQQCPRYRSMVESLAHLTPGHQVRPPNGQLREYKPLIDVAHYDPKKPSLSYFNLVELHVLSATRYREQIPLQRIREAVDYVTLDFPSKHPLSSRQFYHDGKDLFIRVLEHGGKEQTINASRRGQFAIREVVDLYLHRIEYGADGWPKKFFPVRRSDAEHRLFAIQPNLAGGHPVIEGTGIRVSVILGRFYGGDSIEELAEDYDIQPSVVKKAIEYAEAA